MILTDYQQLFLQLISFKEATYNIERSIPNEEERYHFTQNLKAIHDDADTWKLSNPFFISFSNNHTSFTKTYFRNQHNFKQK